MADPLSRRVVAGEKGARAFAKLSGYYRDRRSGRVRGVVICAVYPRDKQLARGRIAETGTVTPLLVVRALANVRPLAGDKLYSTIIRSRESIRGTLETCVYTDRIVKRADNFFPITVER